MNKTENNEIIDAALAELQEFASIDIRKDELMDTLGEISGKSKVELKKAIFMNYALRLKKYPKEHWAYEVDKIPAGLWQPMKKLLTALRIEELKDVKVVRRKGKHDIKQLRETYYGKIILEDLPDLGNRWMLTEEEYKTIELKCRKLGLELPTKIQPTTTELFFEEEI